MGAPRGNRNAAGKHKRRSNTMKTKSGQYVYSFRSRSITVKKRFGKRKIAAWKDEGKAKYGWK